MPTIVKEKKEFDIKEVIKFAMENKNSHPANNFKQHEIEEQMNEIIENLMLRVDGVMPPEVGAKLANEFGKVNIHFTFDRNRPFSQEEITKYNLTGATQKQLITALNKIRMKERKDKKAIWDMARRKEVALFRQYFSTYLKNTYGEHKSNQLGVKVGIGDTIILKTGHYKRLY